MPRTSTIGSHTMVIAPPMRNSIGTGLPLRMRILTASAMKMTHGIITKTMKMVCPVGFMTMLCM